MRGVAVPTNGVAEQSSAFWHSEECQTRLGRSPFRVTGVKRSERVAVATNKERQVWRRVRDGENPGRIERSERREICPLLWEFR